MFWGSSADGTLLSFLGLPELLKTLFTNTVTTGQNNRILEDFTAHGTRKLFHRFWVHFFFFCNDLQFTFTFWTLLWKWNNNYNYNQNLFCSINFSKILIYSVLLWCTALFSSFSMICKAEIIRLVTSWKSKGCERVEPLISFWTFWTQTECICYVTRGVAAILKVGGTAVRWCDLKGK